MGEGGGVVEAVVDEQGGVGEPELPGPGKDLGGGGRVWVGGGVWCGCGGEVGRCVVDGWWWGVCVGGIGGGEWWVGDRSVVGGWAVGRWWVGWVGGWVISMEAPTQASKLGGW